MESTYSRDSPLGSVSSRRRLQDPPYWAAIPKLRQTDLACPMWRYPLGSGGKRVATRPPCLLVFKSVSMMARMKSVGEDISVGGISAGSFREIFLLLRKNSLQP